jgi:hypothetical protein
VAELRPLLRPGCLATACTPSSFDNAPEENRHSYASGQVLAENNKAVWEQFCKQLGLAVGSLG